MHSDPFKEYIKQSEPGKREKGYAWHTAIGLQAVDGLKTSEYLIDTAIKNKEYGPEYANKIHVHHIIPVSEIGEEYVIDPILASRSVEQQAYRSCMGLLKLADKYSARRLEDACTQALSYTASPSYKSVKNILSAKQENPASPEESTHKAKGITRGADFYRRKSND